MDFISWLVTALLEIVGSKIRLDIYLIRVYTIFLFLVVHRG